MTLLQPTELLRETVQESRTRRSLAAGLTAGALLLQSATAEAAGPADPALVEPTAAPSHTTERSLFGPVQVGPVASLGAPDGGRIDLAFRYAGIVSAGAGVSMLPSVPVPGANATLVRVGGDGWVRWHPLNGAFFVGAGAGYTQMKGTLTMPITAFRATSTAQAHAYAGDFYVSPQVGMQWMLPHGITLGFDAGAEVPVATRGPTYDASKYGLVTSVNGTGALASAMHYASRSPVPFVHLLNVGVFL